MGKIISLPTTNHISSERLGGLTMVSGYYQIPETVIAEFFKLLRGGGGPDAFIIKQYRIDKADALIGKQIMHGCVPTRGIQINYKLIRENQLDLEAELDTHATSAFDAIKGRTSRIYQARHHEKNMVFVKSARGLMACGWYDSANSSQKGILMACYMLYAFGAINKRYDGILYDAVYKYLPFESGKYITIETEKAEKIIAQCISAPILAEN